MNEVDPPAPLRLGFARGTAPSKWAERWHTAMPGRPLELVPFEQAFGRPSAGAEGAAEPPLDAVLERCAPGARPVGSDPGDPSRTHHAIRLYEEAVALVVPADHELAELVEIHHDDLGLVALLDHPDHAPEWPAPRPWDDPTWMPADLAAALALVATGLGGLLAPLPLARHLAGKREHAVIRVIGEEGDDPLSGSAIWATWRVDRDAPDIQQLVGIMRGRTARSSREGAPGAGGRSSKASPSKSGAAQSGAAQSGRAQSGATKSGAPRTGAPKHTAPRKISPRRGRPPGGGRKR